MLARIKQILVYLIVIISVISYHPLFTLNSQMAETIRITIFVLTGILLILSLKENLQQLPLVIKVWFLLLPILIVEYLVFIGIFNNQQDILSEFILLTLALSVTIIGYGMNLDSKSFNRLTLVYSLLLVYVGVSQVIHNFGGFVIKQQYADFAKNSFGPMIGTAIISNMIVYNKMSKGVKILTVILSLINFAVLLTIRARAATATLLFFIFIAAAKHLFTIPKTKTQLRNSVFVIIISIILGVIFIEKIHLAFEYIYNSLFISVDNGGDLSSGRTERNILAWNTFLENPFWGLLGTNQEIPWVHNYLLLNLSKYGLTGGMIQIIIYMSLGFYLAKNIIHNKVFDRIFLGFALILYMYFISFAEPTFPFGPGTAVLYSFLCFGQSIKLKRRISVGNNVTDLEFSKSRIKQYY